MCDVTQMLNEASQGRGAKMRDQVAHHICIHRAKSKHCLPFNCKPAGPGPTAQTKSHVGGPPQVIARMIWKESAVIVIMDATHIAASQRNIKIQSQRTEVLSPSIVAPSGIHTPGSSEPMTSTIRLSWEELAILGEKGGVREALARRPLFWRPPNLHSESSPYLDRVFLRRHHG
ncbi:predicted protein [Histoplasma capsulatum var. duboisii H88]|uniref:Predicted protein n=2 Tax=Ajellomyces capsulatus TaxID=5037 RepID=F0UAV4_AJEC8|nr:predicted protein [Histoplasma capsulatum H143]EGC43761.1 predicted protein [Histoplasma capsulatum var. duboisii H88]